MALSPHNSAYLGPGYHPVQQLVLSDDNLLFELTLAGDRTPPQILDVTNGGNQRVYIRKVVLVRGSDDFTLVNPGDWPYHLDPGETFNVVVDFDARFDGQALGLLEIYTNEDRLPYVIGLYSRTQREPLFADLYSDVLDRIDTEAATRALADINQVNARISLDIALRALVASTNATEISARIAGDQALSDRIDDVLDGLSLGSVTVIDQGARDLILIEAGIRETDDASEAFYRLLLQSTFETGLSDANATIASNFLTHSDALGALASRTDIIEASYQTSGDVQSIADARILIEHNARVSALAAEATTRSLLIATVRDETDTKVGLEATTRSASVSAEQTARVAGDLTVAQSVTDLIARTSGGRGITPNGTFEAGRNGWSSSGFTYISDGQGHYIPTSAIGVLGDLRSLNRVPIDANRAYQLNVKYRVFLAPVPVYIGLQCYDIDGNFLGNIYDTVDSGTYKNGSRTVANTYNGTAVMPVPAYGVGHKFPANTVSVALIVLINYPETGTGVPVSTAYGRVEYAWLDDITNAYSVDARVTTEVLALTTADAAMASSITTLSANYTSARADINGLLTTVGGHTTNLVTTNARIDTEQTVRANAILAEASRVDTIIASLSTGGVSSSDVNARILVETNARVSAVAAEASRVDSLLATYSTTGSMNSAISAAVLTETNARATSEGALSSSITAVSVTAAGAAATASAAYTAALDAQGKLTANLVLLADAGNGRAQIALHADSYGSAGVDITGDVHIKGSVTIEGNTIVNGTITASDKVAPGTVTTPVVANNAITHFAALAGDSISGDVSSIDYGASLSFVTSGGLVAGIVSFDSQCSGIGAAGAAFQLMCDGVAITRIIRVGYTGNFAPFTVPIQHTPAAGTHSYQAIIYGTAGGTAAIYITNLDIFLQEFKK